MSLEVPDHVSLWGLMLPLRTELKQYVNVRPVRVLRGIQSPLRNVPSEWINWVIVRENSEGEYAGHGGITHADQPFGVATDVSIFTRPAIERIFRFAFETAKSRPRKKLTMITKSNAQKWGMVYCKLHF
jgi:isocitrate/isopropylmalate dehydrogenase